MIYTIIIMLIIEKNSMNHVRLKNTIVCINFHKVYQVNL